MLGFVGLQAKDQGKTRDAVKLLDDAEKAYRRAVELGPKAPEAWVLLVRLLHKIG